MDPTRRQQAVAAWVLALPFVLLFVVFSLGPVLASLGMSFTDMRRTDIRNPFAVQLVGLDNYVQLVQDPLFRKVTLNTLLYLLLGVPATMAVALAGRRRHQPASSGSAGFFRVGYYLPVVTSIVAVSVVWKFLYRDNGGLFNTVLGWVGIDGPGWLDSTTLALPSLVADGGVAQLRHADGDLPGRPPDHPAGGQRGGRGRRRQRLVAVPPHHAADAATDAAVRRGDHRPRLPPVLRGGVRDDQGRPARLDPVGHLLHLRPVRLRQLRLRRRGQLPAVPRRRAAHVGAVPLARRARRGDRKGAKR